MAGMGGLHMRYLEELQPAETFSHNNEYWFLTGDFKNNGKRLCFNMQTGFAKWLDGNTMVNVSPAYVLDADNNTIPIKKYINETSISIS